MELSPLIIIALSINRYPVFFIYTSMLIIGRPKLCNFIGQKQRNMIEQFPLSSLWDNSSGTVNPMGSPMYRL